MPKDADEMLRIARNVLDLAYKKLGDATYWLSVPDVSWTAEQRAQADAMLRQIEVARAAIEATR